MNMLAPKLMLTLLLGVLLTPLHAQSQRPVITNYSFKFKVNGLKDVDAYLGFHYGDKKFIKDTARVNSKGEVEFTGKDTIQGGIYLFVTPKKDYFEFVVNETKIQMETDTTDMVGKMVVKKSNENALWYDYMKFIMGKQKEIAPYESILKNGDKESKEYKDALDAKQRLSESINTFRDDKIKQNPDLLVTKIFKAMKDIDMSKVDSADMPAYFRNHYFDNIDLSDNRLIRTPVIESKITFFFDKVVMQMPDSIIVAVDWILAQTKGNEEMFKFLCHHLTYNYERSQIMCMDAVFVHLIENYYKKGKTPWVDQKTLDKMIERSDKMKPLRCGERVLNISLPDTGGVWHSLYQFKGDYTILYFWDATCSHCKKSTPVLKELYNTYLKPNGIEIFGVEGELDDKEWKKYMADQDLPWINVSDNPEINSNPNKYILELQLTDLYSLNFRHHFDLYSYPVVYILDKDKNIIAKKLGVEQIKEFIEKYKKAKANEK